MKLIEKNYSELHNNFGFIRDCWTDDQPISRSDNMCTGEDLKDFGIEIDHILREVIRMIDFWLNTLLFSQVYNLRLRTYVVNENEEFM